MNMITVNETQKGILFNKGRYVKTLGPGRYSVFGGRKIDVSSVGQSLQYEGAELKVLMKDPSFASLVSAVNVSEDEMVLHYVDGLYEDCLTEKGLHAFWNEAGEHTFKTVDMSVPEVDETVPASVIGMLTGSLILRADVEEHEMGKLYVDNRFVRLLEPGTYFFWKKKAGKIKVNTVDMRLTSMDITGQEILTQDKVPVRISFTLSYRITDCIRVESETDDYISQLHAAGQLALRDYVGRHSLDEILNSRDELSGYVLEKLREKEDDLYIRITDAGVKDIILPGEIRQIMNSVIAAEKKAQANVITRREEVASTRSLLNTAKLMDENKTLYKLKELEFIERICENVGSINLNGSGDVLSQLLNLAGGTPD